MPSPAIRTAVYLVAASFLAASALSSTSLATVHDGGICWDPDVEYPVPCDDGEDD